jgi:polyisoprenoid-binding protein YceI
MTLTTASTTWNIDPVHSAADFKIRHMMISYVKGKFSRLSDVLKLDQADYTRSSVEASIPVASLSTGDDGRDGHLKNAEFLDIEKFPGSRLDPLPSSPRSAATMPLPVI